MLTEDEAQLYDRQIRLWGVNAQTRLRQSKVLLLGFNGIASEVAKTLVLAGIDTLTIVDDQPLGDSDLTSNLFCRTTSVTHDGSEANFRTHAVKDKLLSLNPLVNVIIDNSSIQSKKLDDFKGYDLVSLHTFTSIDEITRINGICRHLKVKFYLAFSFGFFGFMFNDLGSDFKFTYEGFNTMTQSDVNAGPNKTGQEKNPIVVGDEKDEQADSTSDIEEERPIKRARLEVADKSSSKDDDKKQQRIASLNYSSFQDMISFKSTNFSKKTSPILFITIAMLKFYGLHNRLPKGDENNLDEEDMSKLNEIIASITDTLNIHDSVFKKLSPTWSRDIFGSLSPVCAIVGGVAGQDMIRVLSGKDIPICNTFSFDGINMEGVVERIGIQNNHAKIAQPVVRDCLQIDD